MQTEQMKLWKGGFGREYTDRNTIPINDSYMSDYGVTRTEMNVKFISGFDRSIKILEVGTGIGKQLLELRYMGFTRLWGIELQPYAVCIARGYGLNVKRGSALALPFCEGFFGMVFTSGLLIHIAPSHINQVLDEIYRCSNRYIWGMEYFSPLYIPINYRGYSNLLWKADYASLFQSRFPSLSLIKREFYKYKINSEVDTMFMLEKGK